MKKGATINVNPLYYHGGRGEIRTLGALADSTDFEDPQPRTTVIIIEESYEEAVAKARRFDERSLEGLLRSALPDNMAE